MNGHLTQAIDRAVRHHRARGFTLAESLMAATVLAVVVAAIVGPVTLSYENSQAADELGVAAAMARQLMDEIASKSFADPTDGSMTLGHENDETSRQLYDNIDDYYRYHDTTDTMQRLDGTSLSLGLQGVYSRDVYVEYRQAPGGAAQPSGDFVMVRVTITTPGGQVLNVCRLFAKYPRGN